MAFLKVYKVDQALEILKKEFADHKIGMEIIPISQAMGRILSEDIRSKENIPAFRRSMVDGYGVKVSDCQGASENAPVLLKRQGEVKMGELCTYSLESDAAIYVPTGGHVPEGADGMIMIEETERFNDEIAILTTAAVGENIIEIGDDVKEGQCVLKQGTKIGGHHIGILASLGYQNVPVYEKLKVAIVSTGDEIIPIGENVTPGKIRDCNRYIIESIVEENECIVIQKCHLTDDFDHMQMILKMLVEVSDLIILSGGSSAGAKDYTADAIQSLGEPGVLIHGLAIKPGKPTIVAKVGQTAIFGLPGHPAACFIVLKALFEPFIQQLYRVQPKATPRILCVADFQVHAASGRDTYLMVSLENKDHHTYANALYGKSGMVSQMSMADGYVIIPMTQEGIKRGETIEVNLF